MSNPATAMPISNTKSRMVNFTFKGNQMYMRCAKIGIACFGVNFEDSLLLVCSPSDKWGVKSEQFEIANAHAILKIKELTKE